MDGPIRPRRATILMRMLKLGVCGTALSIMIAACLAVSILYHWHRNLTAYNRFTVMMMIICSMFVLVFYLSIVTSYTTASKLFTGLPQQDIEMVPIRLLTLLEIILLGVFYVFIKTPILHEPSYVLSNLDKMVINFIFVFGTIIRCLLLLILEKLDMEYNDAAFGHVDYLRAKTSQSKQVTVS